MSKFKEAREKAGLSQKQAAAYLDVSVQAVSYWETGSRSPSIEKILQMCDLYRCSADYLLGRKPMDITVVHGEPPIKDAEQLEIVLDPKKDPITPDDIEKRMRKLIADELKKRGL